MVALVVAGIWTACLQSPAVTRATGIGGAAVPFIDLYGLLAAGELAQANGDPFKPNPLDPYNRPHVYTSWWLITGNAGLTRADTGWLGAVLVGLTLVSTLVLIRPRRPAEAVVTLAVLCSPAFLLAVNRANNDLVVFIVLCGALAALRAEKVEHRTLAVVLLGLAAALKYYPLAAAILLLGARSHRELCAGLGLFTFVLLLAWPGLLPGLASAARYKPNPDGLYAFGAPMLFRNLGLTSPVGWLVLTGGLVATAFALARSHRQEALSTSANQFSEREFICGAALVVGCFFLGASYAYKLVFAVWLLPWLWRQGAAPADERWRKLTLALLLAVLWFEGLMAILINMVLTPLSITVARRVLDVTLAVQQVLTWGLVLALTRGLLIYTERRLRFFVAGDPTASEST